MGDRPKLLTAGEMARVDLYAKRRALQRNMFASQIEMKDKDTIFQVLQRWFSLNRPRRGEEARLFVALPDFISTTFADLLFLETPTITPKDEKADGAQGEADWIDAFLAECGMGQCLWESGESASALGDDYWKLFLRESEDVPVFEAQDPAQVFPKFAGGTTPTEIDIHDVIDRDTDRSGSFEIIHIERHFPGTIVNRVVKVNDKNEIVGELSPEDFGLDPMVATGVDEMLVIHVPNRRSARSFFGVSDYDKSMALFEEISHRVIRLVTSLDLLADPKFQGPEDYVDDQGNFMFHGARYYPRSQDDPEVAPITWDNRADMQLATIDHLIGQVLGLTQIWPGLLFPDKFGQADSGRALKLRMMATLWATMRKRKFYSPAIKDLLRIGQRLAEANGRRIGFEPREPTIEWHDILPFDALETAQVETIATRGGIRSRRRAVERMNPSLSSEEIDEEIAAIEDQEAQAVPQFMRTGPNGQTGNGGGRLPAPRLPASL